MPKTLKNGGFGLVGVLIVIVVIAAIGLSGWAVYHHEYKTKTVVATKTVARNTTPKSTSKKATTQPANPYAGWKTYCDTFYRYCLQYPTNWEVTASTSATRIGGEGGLSLLSPSKTVGVTYGNAYVKDSNSVNFMPTTISKLTAANQAVTLVGGYIPSSGDNGIAGNNIPEYLVVDSSFLTTYPLTIGQLGQFPSNPAFTDQYATGYNGSLVSKPAITINTVQQSQAWLTSADAKTSVQILESLYYQ